MRNIRRLLCLWDLILESKVLGSEGKSRPTLRVTRATGGRHEIEPDHMVRHRAIIVYSVDKLLQPGYIQARRQGVTPACLTVNMRCYSVPSLYL
jgi:hypothetical protein